LSFSGLGEIESLLNKQENLHNPFLENSTPKTSFLDMAVDILTAIASRRNSRKYTFLLFYMYVQSLSVSLFCVPAETTEIANFLTLYYRV